MDSVKTYMLEKEGSQQPKPPPKRIRRPYGPDMYNRDPHSLNSHVRPIERTKVVVHPELFTNFEEIIGEPEGSHSDDCIWKNSYKGFQTGKACCYTCLTYVCAIPLAFCWGCNFACITFMHIWSITPLYRVFRINCDCAGKFFGATVHCLCDPVYEALALMFTKIYVHVVNAPHAFKERTYTSAQEMRRAPEMARTPSTNPQQSHVKSPSPFSERTYKFVDLATPTAVAKDNATKMAAVETQHEPQMAAVETQYEPKMTAVGTQYELDFDEEEEEGEYDHVDLSKEV